MARTLRGTGRSSKAPKRKTKPKGKKMRPSMKGGVRRDSSMQAGGSY